ncbi:MAG: PH domain-containing protein [Anaerolineales bacterium]|nr:PH domain-containing protein [Anaerolineales bacterium]MDW8162589.1 PH domain-containing protein [Anaerolineales bacterium]
MSKLDEEVFTPEPPTRNGERNAWLVAFLMVALWLIFKVAHWQTPPALAVLVALTLGVAILISLANWVERKTLLAIGSEGIRFENGLRRVYLAWDEIEQVRVRPTLWGRRVQVRGKATQFAFYTLGELKYRGMVRAKTGFAQGEEILRQTVLKSSLQIAEQLGEEVVYIRQPKPISR